MRGTCWDPCLEKDESIEAPSPAVTPASALAHQGSGTQVPTEEVVCPAPLVCTGEGHHPFPLSINEIKRPNLSLTPHILTHQRLLKRA